MWRLLKSRLFVFILTLTMRKCLAELDILQPYATHHGPVFRRHRDTQQCQHVRFGNTTYSLYKAHTDPSHLSHFVDFHHKIAILEDNPFMQKIATVRYQRVYNPMQTFSVLEPGQPGSCKENSSLRVTVEETSRSRNCMVAANAGFFNTHTGQCLGNIVSDGRLVQDSGGIQNVHFGITKSGEIFTGYLSEIDLITFNFQQLVGGVIWLLRDGELYVDESRDIECPDTEETGTLDTFIEVLSARTAVGHDSEGRVLMVQVDGKTDHRGLQLREFSLMLKQLGFVNAINLDGGGSATSVLNGTVVNYPSDSCGENSTWNCARKVSTILCVHQVDCLPDAFCSHHGQCISGQCQCNSPWSGESCAVLTCPGDCSNHGHCSEGGCLCRAGWRGEGCSLQCPEGHYGLNCSLTCLCLNNGTCDTVSGYCYCQPGFTGEHCQSACDNGFYGEGCSERCICPAHCFCDHVTGTCSNTSDIHDYVKVGHCLATSQIKRNNLVPDQSHYILLWKCIAVATSVAAIVSVGVNIWMIVVLKKAHKSSSNNRRHHAFHQYSSKQKPSSEKEMKELLPLHDMKEENLSDNLSSESDIEMTVFQKSYPYTDSSK